MTEGGSDKEVDLFTKHLHHRQITVLYLCQDTFPPGKFAKGISRNSHFIVLEINWVCVMCHCKLILKKGNKSWMCIAKRLRDPLGT